MHALGEAPPPRGGKFPFFKNGCPGLPPGTPSAEGVTNIGCTPPGVTKAVSPLSLHFSSVSLKGLAPFPQKVYPLFRQEHPFRKRCIPSLHFSSVSLKGVALLLPPLAKEKCIPLEVPSLPPQRGGFLFFFRVAPPPQRGGCNVAPPLKEGGVT